MSRPREPALWLPRDGKWRILASIESDRPSKRETGGGPCEATANGAQIGKTQDDPVRLVGARDPKSSKATRELEVQDQGRRGDEDQRHRSERGGHRQAREVRALRGGQGALSPSPSTRWARTSAARSSVTPRSFPPQSGAVLRDRRRDRGGDRRRLARGGLRLRPSRMSSQTKRHGASRPPPPSPGAAAGDAEAGRHALRRAGERVSGAQRQPLRPVDLHRRQAVRLFRRQVAAAPPPRPPPPSAPPVPRPIDERDRDPPGPGGALNDRPAPRADPPPPCPPPRRRSRAPGCRPASRGGARAAARESPRSAAARQRRSRAARRRRSRHGRVRGSCRADPGSATAASNPARSIGSRPVRLAARPTNPPAASLSTRPSSRPRHPQPTISARANYLVIVDRRHPARRGRAPEPAPPGPRGRSARRPPR